MARWARVVVPAVPHHVTQRGTRRQDVFFRDDDYDGEWEKRKLFEIPNQITRIGTTATLGIELNPISTG